VNEEFANPAAQSEPLPLSSRAPVFLSEMLDSFSFAFFHVSLSSLTHLLGSWCNRFLAEE
jgi:hypothetical protein